MKWLISEGKTLQIGGILRCCKCARTRGFYTLLIQTLTSPSPTTSTSHLKWVRCWWYTNICVYPENLMANFFRLFQNMQIKYANYFYTQKTFCAGYRVSPVEKGLIREDINTKRTFTFGHWITFTFQGLNLTEERWEDVFNLTTFIYPECGAFPDITRVKVTKTIIYYHVKTNMQEWKFWLSGVATLVTGVFGIIGNVVSLLVLCKR